MKVVFISCSIATVYLMFVKFKATYDSNHDTFRMEFLVVPVAGLAFLVNHDFSPLEVCSLILNFILPLVVLEEMCFIDIFTMLAQWFGGSWSHQI